MADKGIIFSAAMVRALLDGRKTQTRRLLKLPPAPANLGEWQASTVGGPGILDRHGNETPECPCVWHTRTGATIVPPYAVGDRLYVRETCRAEEQPEDGMDGVRFLADDSFVAIANDPSAGLSWLKLFNYGQKEGQTPAGLRGKGVPSIHMPRWASRMWLAVTEVRVQRLQECSEADAIAEGIERIDDPRGTAWKSYETYADGKPHPHPVVPNRSPLTSYSELWNSLHTAEGERWVDNPWIVAVTFETKRGGIDEGK